jgi:hypothetical protein
MKKGIFFLTVLLIIRTGILIAEEIPGPLKAEIGLKTDTDYEISEAIGFREYVSLYLENSNKFLNGIQIEVTVSNELKEYADHCMLVIYKQAKKISKNNTVVYQCTPLFSTTLPYKNKIYLKIPLSGTKSENSAENDDSFFLTDPVSVYDFPLLVTVVPLDASITSRIRTPNIYLAVKPVITAMGILHLSVRTPQNQALPYEVDIDGQKISNVADEIVLAAGIHNIRINSDMCKEINGTFAILSGKTTRLEFALELQTTYIIIDVPKGTIFYLDGRKIWYSRQRKISIKEGVHSIVMKIDDMSVSKKFTAERGKIYTISLIFNIIIKED